MIRSRTQAPSQRQLKVGEVVRRTLIEIFARGKMRDERLSRVSFTLSQVRMSADLSSAKVYILPLSGKTLPREETEYLLKGLKENAPWLRGQLGQLISLKVTPRLYFVLDTSFDDADEIRHLLERDKKNDE